MRQITTLPIAPAAITVPAVLSGALPTWCLLALLGLSVLLTVAHVLVTQLIRLRAINKITRSKDALRVIEIEDLPHRRQPK
jgi:hypothetical protein